MLMRRQQGKQHLNEKKRRKRIVKLSKMVPVAKSDRKHVRRLLPYLNKA